MQICAVVNGCESVHYRQKVYDLQIDTKGEKKCERHSRSGRGQRSRVRIKLTCAHCKKVFLSNRTNRKFCSIPCCNAARPHLRLVCPICKCSYRTRPSFVKKGGGSFCSRRCRSISIRMQWASRTCSNCGKEIKRSYKHLFRSSRVFCCSLCHIVFRAQEQQRQTMLYTPEFLRFLKESESICCPFPDCSENRVCASRSNIYGLCKTHGRRIYAALHRRKHVKKF